MALELPGWGSLKAPPYAKWEAVKDKTLPPIDGVFDPATAHRFVREKITYRPEGLDDWSEPALTLKRGYGDCEDFCLLERALLLAAGWKPPIYLLIAHDLLARLDHALLVTQGEILDCRTPRLIPVASFADYRPIFAFSSPPNENLTFGRRRP